MILKEFPFSRVCLQRMASGITASRNKNGRTSAW